MQLDEFGRTQVQVLFGAPFLILEFLLSTGKFTITHLHGMGSLIKEW